MTNRAGTPVSAPARAPAANSPSREDAQRLNSTVRALFDLGDAMSWRSHDPYDLLSSPFLAGAQRRSILFARAAVQTGRRTGDMPRRLLRVPRHEEAKTLSDFLSAAVILAGSEQGWASHYVAPLTRRLIARAVPTANGAGWGLEFPYTTRFVNAPARTPNIYQTVNAIQALLDGNDHTPSVEALNAAEAGIRFVRDSLGYERREGRLWFRYWPGLDAPIINVQALAAAAFARAAEVLGDGGLGALADEAASTVVSAQHAPGFWYYEDTSARFIDGFHTGFILQGLVEYARWRGSRAVAVGGVVRDGMRFFREHLMSGAGLPLDFADGRVTADGQSSAQCIQTLALCGDSADDGAVAARVWRLMNRRWKRTVMPGLGATIRRALTPDYPALRWTAGPFALATAHLLHAGAGTSGQA
jgi:hypothetical protein